MKQSRAQLKKYILLICVTLSLLLLCAYYLYLHNFSVVIPQQIYRSRQLSYSQFQHAINHYQIKAIINLRGEHPEESWYRDELQVVSQHHLQHFDFALSSKQLPPRDILKKLALTIDSSQKPLLIHCESGVDRTGLAAVLSLILANQSIDVAAQQISIKYFVFSNQSAGVQFVHLYKAWLAKNNLKSSREGFYRWLIKG